MSLVTVFGGTGFLGQRVVAALGQAGHHVRIVSRRPERTAIPAAKTSGTAAVDLVRGDVRERAAVAAVVADADAVVNAVGHYVETAAVSFIDVHVDGARNVALAAAAAGATRLVHLSGIGADHQSRSAYVRSRGEGERVVKAAFPAATILRPSAMFAGADGISAMLAELVRRSPVVPLFGRGRTRLQPVFADDVALAVARVLEAGWTAGRVLELGGPDVLTYRELVEQAGQAVGRRPLLLPVPFVVWQVLAAACRILAAPPLTEGQVALMRHDNVTSADAPGLAALGIEPTPLATVWSRRPT